ncbi:hypothetical protein SUGI_0664370 [Cryptomeria japonica]|nr:hypothetical protein SUGI_0664370 [Cryptomeria japonica]
MQQSLSPSLLQGKLWVLALYQTAGCWTCFDHGELGGHEDVITIPSSSFEDSSTPSEPNHTTIPSMGSMSINWLAQLCHQLAQCPLIGSYDYAINRLTQLLHVHKPLQATQQPPPTANIKEQLDTQSLKLTQITSFLYEDHQLYNHHNHCTNQYKTQLNSTMMDFNPEIFLWKALKSVLKLAAIINLINIQTFQRISRIPRMHIQITSYMELLVETDHIFDHEDLNLYGLLVKTFNCMPF